MPVTGGSNIPALNYLLASWGMALTDKVYEGDFHFGEHAMHYATGTSLARFPKQGIVLRSDLNDLGGQMLNGDIKKEKNVPILGLYQTVSSQESTKPSELLLEENNLVESDLVGSLPENNSQFMNEQPLKPGRLVVYGDSNCLDSSHLQKDCFWLLDALLEYTMTTHTAAIFTNQAGTSVVPSNDLPARLENSNLHKHSKVSWMPSDFAVSFHKNLQYRVTNMK